MEFNFPDGTDVLVEVWPTEHATAAADALHQMPGSSAIEPVGIGARVVQHAGQSLNDAFAPLVPVLRSLHDQVTRLPQAPEELTVEFGIKLTAGLKLAIISGGEASFNVSATWRLNSTSVSEVGGPEAVSE
ncbi:CU044_2847 family protein [Kitasatospora sp. NPDC058444]|uniref:CU044_2847 family protein n=1 Tax=Kitasatospora sp. NPDC058444 TaxID=3346504 RepID=UPI003662E8F3